MDFLYLDHITGNEELDIKQSEKVLDFFNITETDSADNKWKFILFLIILYIIFSLPILDSILMSLFSYCASSYIRFIFKVVLFAILIYVLYLAFIP